LVTIVTYNPTLTNLFYGHCGPSETIHKKKIIPNILIHDNYYKKIKITYDYKIVLVITQVILIFNSNKNKYICILLPEEKTSSQHVEF